MTSICIFHSGGCSYSLELNKKASLATNAGDFCWKKDVDDDPLDVDLSLHVIPYQSIGVGACIASL